jgi:hypothetical protein
MRVLFTVTLFVSAFLLFLVQPMIAKMMLPRFGGSAAVWSTSLVFFQVTLLAGYAWAHLVSSKLGLRIQFLVHLTLILIPLSLLPIAIPEKWSIRLEVSPPAELLGILLLTIGLPFFAISINAPLLQRWFAHSSDTKAHDPYFLYAASNAGSMLALLCYPFLIEPTFTLRQQSGLWAGIYIVLVVLIAACGVALLHTGQVRLKPMPASVGRANLRPDKKTLPKWSALRWVVLSLAPASLMVGTTNYLSSDVAAVPLLWVVPLALYLLTFILAFGGLPRRVYRVLAWILPVTVLWQTFTLLRGTTDIVHEAPLHLTTLFLASLACHGQLAASRPPPERLTAFYMWIGLGGALGSALSALVAPILFNSVVEYPIALVLALALLPPCFATNDRPFLLWISRLPSWGLAAILAGVFLWHGWSSQNAERVVWRDRSFFSVLRVTAGSQGKTYSLIHGNVRHGAQLRSDDARQRRLPLLYFFPTSPIGRLFQALRDDPVKQRVAVVGLGVGALASYGEAGEQFCFFEIDPAVERIARNFTYFTYLRDATRRGVDIQVFIGDARLTLRDETDWPFGIIVLDAFSGDAIPVHLLTREALQLYLERLLPNGVIAFHITNDYLDLEPVLAALAQDAGLVGFIYRDTRLAVEDEKRGKAPSVWVVMALSRNHLKNLVDDPAWKPVLPSRQGATWTDDYSNLFSVLMTTRSTRTDKPWQR